MISAVELLAETVLAASRKGLLRQKPVFEPYMATSPDELNRLEEEIGVALPEDLRAWLLVAGYGDIHEELSFRKEWMARVEAGPLKGGGRFAQDALGNFYAFDVDGRIFYLCRSAPVFAEMAKDFQTFLNELVQRDYRVEDWVETLTTERYEWGSLD